MTSPGVRLSNTPAPSTPASAPSAPAAPQAMARIRSTGTPWSSAAKGSSAVASRATPGELRKNAASARATPASTARITMVCHSTIDVGAGEVEAARRPGGGTAGPAASNTLISIVVSSSATPAVATSEVTGETLPSGRITTA